MATLDQCLVVLTFVAALGSGLMAGVFFAFSTFVMKALARLPAREGIAAMQSINIVVINPAFLGVFLGTAVACVAVLGGAVLRWETSSAACLLAGGALLGSAVSGDHRFLLATPVLINAGLFITFAGSLRTDTPLIERFARMQVSDLSAEELRYCRSVTQVWSAFFVLNGGTALALALFAPLA